MTGPTILYRSGYKHQLARDYQIRIPWLRGAVGETSAIDGFLELDPDGTLLIRVGYAWDGASGPTVDTQSFRRAALVHDALYQLMRAGILKAPIHRKPADEFFRALIGQDVDRRWPGTRWGWFRPLLRARADLWLSGVRIGAAGAASPEARKRIYEAP